MDIATDFSKFARQFAIDYVTKTYGQKAVAGIMTKGKFGAKQAPPPPPKKQPTPVDPAEEVKPLFNPQKQNPKEEEWNPEE